MKTIGVLTIGQAPRADDSAAELRRTLGSGYAIAERGALDGLSRAAIAELAPEPGEYLLITLLADGTSVTLGKPKILPLLQRQIDAFGADGVDAILLLCTGTFPEFKSERLIVQPQPVLYRMMIGLAGPSGRIGALTPLAGQLTQARAKWWEFGVDPILGAASPYAGADEVSGAAREVAEQGADVIFMDCMGYSLEMKARAREAAGGRPVVLARSAIARVLAEIVD
jgi:protein AroM